MDSRATDGGQKAQVSRKFPRTLPVVETKPSRLVTQFLNQPRYWSPIIIIIIILLLLLLLLL